jgi:hypothetical protein
MRLVISMMAILLVILVTFYISILNGLDQSLQFHYFIMVLIISIAVCGMLFIKNTWKDQWVHICIISVILICSVGFGFLSQEELNKVEVNVIKSNMESSVHAQFVVSGLFKNIPTNKDIWIYVVPSLTKKYYPEPVPVIKLNDGHLDDGSWEYYYIMGVNGFKGAGKSFQIGIFISNKTDKIYIEKEIMRVNGSTKGMNRLPNKIEDMGIKLNVTAI